MNELRNFVCTRITARRLLLLLPCVLMMTQAAWAQPANDNCPMRITIFAAGSRGDIQPCLVLGKALRQAGFSVLLAAPENFAGFVQEHGLEFHPLRGDVQQIMATEDGRSFMEGGNSNFLQSI